MSYLMLIRYKDGRDKLIEITSKYCPLIFPSMMTKQRAIYPPIPAGQTWVPAPSYESVTELSTVQPIQSVLDVNGIQHWICIEEILDVTVEEIE